MGKLQSLAVSALLLIAGVPKAYSQTPRATLADSMSVADGIFARIFQGIHLTQPMHDTALVKIRHTFVIYYSMMPVQTAERWHAIAKLFDQRDSALVALGHDSAEKHLIEQRLADERPRRAR